MQKVGAFLFALCGVFALGLAIIHVAKPLFASGPSSNRVLNYQIRLTDSGGIPLTGTQNVKLSFYTVASGGTPIHTDCGTTGTPVARKIVVTSGIGSVLIGDTAAPGSVNCADASQPNALPANLFNNTALYLGVTVGADAEMSPRKRIVAQGYALNADMLDDLETSAIGGVVAFVPVTDSSGNLVLTQNLTVDASTLFVDATNNRVGMGIGGPDSQLDIGSAYSAGAGADYFTLDVNPTVTAGANDQVVSLVRLRQRGGTGGFTNVRMPLLLSENTGGGQFKVQLFETGLRIGNYTGGTASVATPSANLELDGFGSSSATFVMQAENLAGADVFAIRDDGRVGVRTFAPGATLDVHGGILANGDQIVDEAGDLLTDPGVGTRTPIAEGATLTSAAGQGICTNSLSSPFIVYKDGNGDCVSGNGGTDVRLLGVIADLPSATVAVTAAWAFNDADTDCNGDGTGGDVSCTASDGIYQLGQDLYIDNDPALTYTSPRVGIGTTNPGSMLDVVGRGDGDFGGFPSLVNLKTANSNTWNLVLSNQRAGGESNVTGFYMADPSTDFDYTGAMFVASYADDGNSIVDPIMLMMPGSGSVGIGQYYDYPTKFTVYAEPQFANVGGTTTANASTTVTGVGTKFSTRIGLGDRISLSSAPTVFATVTAIASDTSLTVDRPLGNGTSQTINVRQGIMRLVTGDDAITRMLVNDVGNVLLGSTLAQPVTKLDLFGNTRLTGKATAVLSGSIDPAASTTVTGVGTAFLRELVVGDRITVTGETRTVTAIASDTSLTVDSAFTDNANDTSPDALFAIATMRDSANALQLVVNNLGNVGIGTTAPGQKLVVNGFARVGESATAFNDFGLPFQFVVNAERTDTSGTPYGTYSRLALNPASASTAQPIAMSALLEINGTNSTGSSTGLNAAAQKYGSGAATAMRSLNVFTYNNAGNVTDMHAIRSLNQTQGGTITNAYGLQYQLFQNGGATTNAYGLKVESPSMGGGTITNLYGIHIDPQTAGGTSNFALLYNGSSPFAVTGAGSVGVGTSNPASFKLQVDGHVGPNLDDTYDLGSNSLRWRDLYLGPASLHIGAAGNEAVIRYDAASSKLSIDKPVDFTSAAGLSLDQGSLATSTGGFGTYVNHLLYSEQFNQSTWVKTGVTVTADNASGPDAQLTADLINAGGAATDGVRRTVASPPMLVAFGNRTWTGSVWLKAVAGTPSVTLVLDSSTVAEPSTNTVTLSTEWKRYSVTHTFTTGTGAPVFEVRNGTNAIYAWGAQLEYASTPGVYARTEASLVASVAAGTPNAGLVGNGSLLFSGSTGTTPMYGSGTRMMWIPAKSAFRAGYATNNWDDGFIGTYSAAFGNDTRASGFYSFAGGNQSTATSTNSFAFGAASVSSNFATIAMGSNAQATGSTAIALGANAFASGGGALAIGNDISSSGVASAVIGNYVNASANYATVIGHGVDSANRITNNTADSLMIGFNSTIPTFFVGPSAGTGTTGNVGVGTSAPLARLDLAGNLRTTGKATAVLTGSIDPAASTTVTGVGTLFTSQLVVGDRITVTGQTRTVTAIATDTSLTVDAAFSDNANDTSPDVLYAIATMRDSSNAVKLVVNDLGNIGIGEAAPSFSLDVNGTSGMRVTGPSMYGLMLKSSHATSDFMGIRWRDNANANLWSMGNDFNGTGGHDFWLYDNVNSRTVLLADQGATSYLSFGTTNGGVEYDNATQQLRLFANGSNKLFVNSSGNVGIGVSTAPFGKLQVDASAAGTMAENLWLKNSAAATVDSSANIVFAAASGAGSTTRYAEIRGVATDVSVNPDGALAFVTMKDGAISERMRVDADGRVGINVIPTSNSLQVENVAANGSAPILSKYLTTSASGAFSVLTVLAETSGDMVDTFGAVVQYQIDDAASAVQTIGYAGFVRDGNDGLGRFTVNPVDSGSSRADAFNVQWGDATGPEVGIGVIDPATALHVVVSDSIGTVPPVLRLQNTTDHPAADVGIRFNSFNQDFSMGIDETDDSFRVTDGVDLTAPARLVIDSTGNATIGGKVSASTAPTSGSADEKAAVFQISSSRAAGNSYGADISATEGSTSNNANVFGVNVTAYQAGTSAGTVRGVNVTTGATGSANTVTLYGAKIDDAGSAANSTGDHYGIRLDVTTGTAGVHYGVYSNVSGGTNAYPGIFMGGNVGIGIATPAANLEVRSSTSAIRASYDADTYLDIDPFVGSNGVSIVFADAGANQANLYYNIANDALLVNSTGNSATAINTNAGNVGVGDISPDFKFDVDAASATVAGFNRTTTDGTIISLMQDGVEEGSISVSGNTISYNAFTGSHYAWTEDPQEKGMLMTLTGENRHLHGRAEGEMLYGVALATEENDAKVLGAYLALQEPNRPADDSNPHLVMAVGNGDVWVVDGGQDVATGDYLIAAATPGHAVKDPATADVSHVVARAAEPVDWEAVTDLTADGKKHKLVSVTFESFSSRNVQPGVFGAKLSELTVDAGLDMRGYAIWGISSLRGLGDIWSIDDAGKLVVKEVVADQVAIRQTDAKSTLDASSIPSGQDYAQVHNAAVNAATRVFVTFRKNPGSAWWVEEVTDGLFVVKTALPVTEDVAFDYWLVQTLDERTAPQTTVELPPAPAPEPDPVPQPEPEAAPEPPPTSEPEPASQPEPAPEPAP